MKKQLLTLLACGTLATFASAQGKISPDGMLLLHDYNLRKLSVEYQQNKHTLSEKAVERVSVIIALNPGASVEFLDELGLTPDLVLDDIVTVIVPMDMIELLAQRPEVQSMDFGRTQSPSMNYARPSGNVDQVQNGFTYSGKSYNFDGTGVITGVMDTGLDPNHANFRDADGNLRVKRFWNFNGTTGTSRAYTTPSAIAAFSTDCSTATHGTHVAGIMAGSYTGTGTWISQTSPTTTSGFSERTSALPYKGVATGSEIAMSGTATLTDANIVNGVSNIVTYAEAENKPCVINMSLGSNSGPHDGSDPYSRSLAALGKRAIICISAGNEGDQNMYIGRSFSGTSTKFSTFIAGNTASQANISIWTNDANAITVSWIIYDTSAKTTTTVLSSSSSSSGNMTVVGNSSSYTQNAAFNAAFTGYVSLASNLTTYNNRYNVDARLNITPKTGNATKRLGLLIEGKSGQKVYVYGSDCEFEALRSYSGSVGGNNTGSINDAACGENVISVGSYNTRTTWGILRTGYYGNYTADYVLNEISPFSSFGETYQRVPKPDVCAPGAGIISSISTPYVESNGVSTQNLTASANVYSRNNYWNNMQGTSMSCPYFSGVVALWLEADHNLNYSDIIEIVNKTSLQDAAVTDSDNSERWGAGKVDALAGIKYVLERKAAISGVDADNAAAVIVTPVNGGYELFAAGAQSIDAAIYSINGMKAADCHISGSQGVIATDGLPKGVYILTVDTPMGRHTSKVTVK